MSTTIMTKNGGEKAIEEVQTTEELISHEAFFMTNGQHSVVLSKDGETTYFTTGERLMAVVPIEVYFKLAHILTNGVRADSEPVHTNVIEMVDALNATIREGWRGHKFYEVEGLQKYEGGELG